MDNLKILVYIKVYISLGVGVTFQKMSALQITDLLRPSFVNLIKCQSVRFTGVPHMFSTCMFYFQWVGMWVQSDIHTELN